MKRFFTIAAVVIVLGGAYLYFAQPVVPQPGGSLTEAQARVIAENSCIKGGAALEAGQYNAVTKTWRYSANLNATRPSCTPACVVSEAQGTAAVAWECTEVNQADSIDGDTVIVAGKVVAINLEQAMVDGPYLITLESAKSKKYTVAVPARGFTMCVANQSNSVADVSQIKTGEQYEVRGSVNANGYIMPCESADHYLRLVR